MKLIPDTVADITQKTFLLSSLKDGTSEFTGSLT